MKLKKLIRNFVIFLSLAIIAVACQSAEVSDSVTSSPIPESSDEYPSPDSSAYPVPTYPSTPYPSSDDSAYLVPTIPSVLYPDAEDGGQVLWHQAVSMINNNEVTQVTQTHDLKVYLTLKDGRTLITEQPVIDEVIRVIEQCGEKCKNIRIATE